MGSHNLYRCPQVANKEVSQSVTCRSPHSQIVQVLELARGVEYDRVFVARIQRLAAVWQIPRSQDAGKIRRPQLVLRQTLL